MQDFSLEPELSPNKKYSLFLPAALWGLRGVVTLAVGQKIVFAGGMLDPALTGLKRVFTYDTSNGTN